MTARRGIIVIGSICAALTAGCATTDPSGDIRASAGQVSRRTGLPVAWRSGGADANAAALWDGRGGLTARQAVTTALADNPAVRADLAAVAAARADFAQAHLLANPVANVTAAWSADGAAGMLAAGVMQSLSELWLLPARKDAAQARLQHAVLRAADNAIDLAAAVEQSHRRVVFHQRLLPVLAERRRLLSLAREAAEAKVRAGLGTSLDINRVRTALLETEADQRSARSDLAIEKRSLLERIGRADAPARWSAVAGATDANSPPGEHALVTLAKAHRLDLLAAAWTVRGRQARLREAELEAYPEVGLGAGAEREAPADGKAMVKVGPSLRVELPIFDQGQAQIAKAEAELEQARMAARAADQRATLEVRRAREALETAGLQCQAYRAEIVPLAERNVADAQSAFEAGEADLLDLLTAQQNVTRARALLLEHQMRRDLARIDLARAVGGKTILESPGKK